MAWYNPMDLYRSATDSFKSGRLTEEEAKAELKSDLDSTKEDLAAQGTSTDSIENVGSNSKASRNATMNGGATFFTTEVSPTDFVPNPDKRQSSQTPDFYRNGQHKVETITVDGEEHTRTYWAPVPKLIGERETPLLANIRLIAKGQPNADDRNSPGNRLVPEYTKFFLESVQEGHQEKFQTVETFNDWYVFFYGEKPPIYNFSGHLLNLHNYNWMNEFMYYYENFWRGTKAVELGAKVFLTYNYQQVQGYIVNVNTNINAATDKGVPFSVSMLVTKRLIFNGSPDDNVIRDSLVPGEGLVDTNASASPFSQQLVAGYLSKTLPAKNNGAVTDQNLDQAEKTVDEKSQSTVVQNPHNPGDVAPVVGQTIGFQRAVDLTKKWAGLA